MEQIEVYSKIAVNISALILVMAQNSKKYHTWKHFEFPLNCFIWQKCIVCGLFRRHIGVRQYVFSFDRHQLELVRPDCNRDAE